MTINLETNRFIWKYNSDSKQTSVDSTVRVLSLSRFRPDFPENRARCLPAVRIFYAVAVRILFKNYLSGFCLDISSICIWFY